MSISDPMPSHVTSEGISNISLEGKHGIDYPCNLRMQQWSLGANQQGMPLVFVHGWLGGFIQTLNELEDDLVAPILQKNQGRISEVIGFNRIGCGRGEARSEGTPPNRNIETLSKETEALMLSLGHKECIAAGQSFGAIIAAHLAACSSELRVKALLLLDPQPLYPDLQWLSKGPIASVLWALNAIPLALKKRDQFSGEQRDFAPKGKESKLVQDIQSNFPDIPVLLMSAKCLMSDLCTLDSRIRGGPDVIAAQRRYLDLVSHDNQQHVVTKSGHLIFKDKAAETVQWINWLLNKVNR